MPGVGRLPVKCMAEMGEAKIDFAASAWDEPRQGVRSKAAVRGGKQLRLVEFAESFVEHDWCTKAHVGYVLDGELEIIFPGGVERFSAGDGIMITGGEEWRHKARAVGRAVRLVLVEDE